VTDFPRTLCFEPAQGYTESDGSIDGHLSSTAEGPAMQAENGRGLSPLVLVVGDSIGGSWITSPNDLMKTALEEAADETAEHRENHRRGR
jgi:hypothetical protein